VLMLSLAAAEDDKQAEKPVDKPAAKAEEKPVDLDKVPDGTNAELLKYIEQVLGTQPKNMADLKKMSAAIIKASDKILDAQPTEQELKSIVGIRMELPLSPEEIVAFADKLTKLGASETQADKADFGREVTSISYLVRLSAVRDKPDEFKKTVGQALAHLGDGTLQKGDLMLVVDIAQSMDQVEDLKFAGETMEKLLAIVKESKIDNVDKLAKNFEGVLRRLKLPGHKIELEGNLLSGGKLDLAKYDGKVVLVDFWATWCRPCLEEMPHLKKNYEAYHEKGFEILGFSCDRTKEAVEKFVKDREIPWPIVYGDGAPSPTFEF